jgi:hypothetical protein
MASGCGTWHNADMANDATYIAHYVDPNGVQSVLGHFHAANEQAALLQLGKLVREMPERLHLDGNVSLTSPDGTRSVGAYRW